MAQSQDQPPRPTAQQFVIPDRRGFLEALDLTRPQLAQVKAAMDRGDVDVAGRAYAARFRARSFDTPLLNDWKNIPRDPDHVDAIAEDCLRGRLNDGYNVYDIPDTGIDWYDCPLFCLPRFPIFPALISSWHHHRDPRYLRFAIDHATQYMAAYPIESFAGKHSNEGYRNHYLVGPPTWWCLCPQRIERWLQALVAFRESPLLTDEEILTGLHRTLQEIRYFLTQIPFWVEHRHNAASYDIRVMGIFARVFDDFTEASDWRVRNADWLARYIDDAFYPDGWFKELALGYSSSVTSQTALIASELYEQPAMKQRREKLIEMMRVLVAVARPDGRIPHFGDGYCQRIDDLWCAPLARKLGEPWMDAINVVFKGSGDDEQPFVRGTSRPPIADYGAAAPPFTVWPAPGVEAWGGYYAMRDHWRDDACYMMIDAGPWGTTHQHMDKLSFELAAYGANFITDPGNTLYANNLPDARITMLNAGFLHNTITVNDVDEHVREAAEWSTDQPLTNRWEQGPHYLLFQGSYDFGPDADVIWHRRVLFVDRRYWLVQDVLTAATSPAADDPVRVEQNFQFERDIRLMLEDDGVRAVASNGAQLRVVPLDAMLRSTVVIGDQTPHVSRATQYAVTKGPEPFDHGRGWISRITHKPDPAPALLRTGKVVLPCMITLALVPCRDAGGALPDIKCVSEAEDSRQCVWELQTNQQPLRWRTSVNDCDVICD